MNTTLSAWIDGIGLLAPGLPNWPAAAVVLRGDAPCVDAPTELPPPAILPPAERRRASRIVKLALAAGVEAVTMAGADAAQLATVFSASCGDGHNCHALCEQLASDDRQISPTRFHNSVHNTAAGYWGIATGAMAPCQVLCAYDASFGAGLIEALAQVHCERRPILLVAYDAEYPEPIRATRPTRDAGAVALLLSPERTAASRAAIAVTVSESAPEALADAALETLRANIPALRALPMLALLARNMAGSATLDYLAPSQLAVTVTPC